jgi:uncharacterized membrane protein YkvA (DUF1232 family)
VSVVVDAVTMVRRLRRDPRVPRSVRVVLVVAGLWLLSPIDPIPDFIPVLGQVDDVLMVAWVVRFTARRVPRAALEEAWPGDPAVLDRLLRRRGRD